MIQLIGPRNYGILKKIREAQTKLQIEAIYFTHCKTTNVISNSKEKYLPDATQILNVPQ